MKMWGKIIISFAWAAFMYLIAYTITSTMKRDETGR